MENMGRERIQSIRNKSLYNMKDTRPNKTNRKELQLGNNTIIQTM